MMNNNHTGVVFDIQRYSIHDGPGIRTLVFMKGCPLRCKWCANPEGLDYRIDITSDPKRCIGCGKCMNACPVGAIQPTENGMEIDREKCMRCGKCAEACPSGSKNKVGNEKTVEQIVKIVKRERMFYQSSGGGVTMGGGEILNQADFVYAVLSACKSEGINTAIETSGCGKWSDLEKIVSVTDTVFMDMKAFNTETHKRLTGVDNALILENIKKIDELFETGEYENRQFVIRIPVIPGANDSEDEIRMMAEYLSKLKGYTRVELLPFHNFGENKWTKLNKSYDFHGLKNSTADQLEPVLALMTAHGVNAKICTW